MIIIGLGIGKDTKYHYREILYYTQIGEFLSRKDGLTHHLEMPYTILSRKNTLVEYLLHHLCSYYIDCTY
ncbi:Uncharacterised protein [uncultured archaeon]|nr:Uncharacterised protein [uncultured archaeon]